MWSRIPFSPYSRPRGQSSCPRLSDACQASRTFSLKNPPLRHLGGFPFRPFREPHQLASPWRCQAFASLRLFPAREVLRHPWASPSAPSSEAQPSSLRRRSTVRVSSRLLPYFCPHQVFVASRAAMSVFSSGSFCPSACSWAFALCSSCERYPGQPPAPPRTLQQSQRRERAPRYDRLGFRVMTKTFSIRSE